MSDEDPTVEDILGDPVRFAACPNCEAEYPEFHGTDDGEHTLCSACGWSSEENNPHFESHPFTPDWVVCPGETLQEWLDHVSLPPVMAGRYGISDLVLKGILAGTQPIDDLLAAKLSHMTMITQEFWLALEHNYRAGLAKGLSHPHD